MNIFGSSQNEAVLQYESGDYHVIKSGAYVRCAVTQEKIPLDELSYWNFERQEAYINCEVSFQRELECNAQLRKLMPPKSE